MKTGKRKQFYITNLNSQRQNFISLGAVNHRTVFTSRHSSALAPLELSRQVSGAKPRA